MTVRLSGHIRKYTGLASDTKPTIWNTETTAYLPDGSEFYELDTRKTYTFDGNGTWYTQGESTEVYDKARFYLDDRVDIAITTTSSHLYAGDALTKYGDLLRQYTVTLADSTGDPTRTMSIVDSNSVTVWTSTAITDNTSITKLLPTSEQVVLEGTYSVVWTLSTNSPTTGITDYYTLGFER